MSEENADATPEPTLATKMCGWMGSLQSCCFSLASWVLYVEGMRANCNSTMLRSESGPFPAPALGVELLRIHAVFVRLISVLLHFFPSRTHHDNSMLPAQ